MASEQSQSAVLLAGAGESAPLLEKVLTQAGCRVQASPMASQALELTEGAFFDLAFLEHQPGQEDSEKLLNHLVDYFPETVVIVLGPSDEVPNAVEAMRLGAFNYLPQPLSDQDIRQALQQALEYRRIRQERANRQRQLSRKYDVKNIVGSSQPMQEVFRLIHKVAPTDANVLVLGESGTGKELVARAIHYHSPRRDKPLIPVNCGAIPEDLLESELFGHEKGSFTGAVRTRLGRFELAQGGTIFLDEIGDMSPMLQVKLLRVLQEHQFERVGGVKTIEVDIRVIAATNQNLEKRVEAGRFREDLYYRLNVVPIKVPPLRERLSDIPLLCDHFLERLSLQKGIQAKKLDPQVTDRLMRHHWQGNVRELENLLERMVILAEGDSMSLRDLPPSLAGAPTAPPAAPAQAGPLHQVTVPDDGLDFNAAVDAFERGLILQALEQTGWVKNRAAALLKLNRTTLVEKIKKKGLVPAGTSGTS